LVNIREEQRLKKEARAQAAAGKKELYRQLFGSDAGKEVLKDLKAFSGYGEDVFAMSPDERTNTYNQGRQSVLIHIKKFLEE